MSSLDTLNFITTHLKKITIKGLQGPMTRHGLYRVLFRSSSITKGIIRRLLNINNKIDRPMMYEIDPK